MDRNGQKWTERKETKINGQKQTETDRNLQKPAKSDRHRKKWTDGDVKQNMNIFFF